MGNIRALNPDAAILLQTIYNPQTRYVGEVYAQGAARINAKMREYAQANPGQILLVDVAAALTDSDRDFAEDRIHPSAAGNEKIAVEVLKTLKENGLGESAQPVILVEGIDARGTGGFTAFVNFYGTLLHILAVIRNLFSGFGA